MHRVVENGATTLREPIAGRVEALVLLFLRYDVEGCVFGGDWIGARSSERLKVILALHVELLLLFLVSVTRHHCHLLRQVFEVDGAPVFIKLALCPLHVLDLLHVNRVVLHRVLARAGQVGLVGLHDLTPLLLLVRGPSCAL